MACTLIIPPTHNKLQLAVPRDLTQDIPFQHTDWPSEPPASPTLPAIMKFPINVLLGKKPRDSKRSTLDTEHRHNHLNTLFSSQPAGTPPNGHPCPTLLTASTPQMVCPLYEVNNNTITPEGCGLQGCLDANGNRPPSPPPPAEGGTELQDVCSMVPSEDQRSRSSSQCDDSGFNSCASDDREDDAVDNTCQVVDHTCQADKEEKDSNNLSFPRRVFSESELSKLDGKCKTHHHKSRSTLAKKSSLLLGLKHPSEPDAFTTDSKSDLTSTPATAHRAHRRRRARSDQNNNDVPGKPLHAYLRQSSTHLVDVFHKNGLMTLVACIIYTVLISMVVVGLGFLMAAGKTVVGQDDLKDLKDHIQSKRRQQRTASRTAVTSG